ILNQGVINHAPTVLVMTSGNISDEPISYKNEEAFSRLKGIADYFLINDREIHIRCDDSVIRCFSGESCGKGKEMILRRARGYVPEPVELPFELKSHILSCGAELKNTFCLARDNYAFVSHHIGDLENLETLTSFEQGIEHFKNLFSIIPEVIAYDLHPEYLSTKYAKKLSTLNSQLLTLGVQHHHAHIASCMAENGITQKVIGVAFDGLGYGSDGTLWGGEFLVADLSEFKRVGHFKYVPMPGGTQAIEEPYRMAVSYLHQIYGEDTLDLGIEFTKRIDKKRWKMLTTLINKRINSPIISSVGRLFDAVSSLIGIRDKVNYEGQAAIELEMIVDENCIEEYNYEIKSQNSMLIIAPAQIFAGIIEDLKSKRALSIISAKFHNTIGSIIRDVVLRIRELFDLNEVVLSGGVFQNMFLLHNAVGKLREDGFNVYTHHKVPTNDGGISLGQVVIANARILCV
ncbi:carbamoyltransferase HypF, partial [candidate division WOR-3 bacterium]|nr:carbamoyltransferase HypF [candidate division WOR-3 bacterium]